ncbi:MAG: DUF2249 domain-containing protein [Verrucomicrobiota bacterium]|nr:DUF2249 domain-containing protein [Verrucomicrobiota bacterium]
MPPISRFKRFDARDLICRGTEPFPEVRRRVNALKPSEGMVVVAPFLPSQLVEKHGDEGFAAKLERGRGGDWIVYFWRKSV